MSKKRPGSKNRIKIHAQPNSFADFQECVRHLKTLTYLIVRKRAHEQNGKKMIKWTTLGTGFLASPNRLLTAAHVMDDVANTDENYRHKEGDHYWLIRHDDEYGGQVYQANPVVHKSLFIYPDVDLSVVYLEDNFYTYQDKQILDKDADYLRIASDFRPIGQEVGVLGYPMCQLTFDAGDIKKPLFGNVLLRVDKGVVNCMYKDKNHINTYEFTMAFNPGNSGGPIFDAKTGKVISIVHGYRSVPINVNELEVSQLSDGAKKGIKMYSQPTFLDATHATYSVGIAVPSFTDILKQHDIKLF